MKSKNRENKEMKSIITILLLGLMILGSCETRTFQYVSTVTRNMEFTVNQQGAFNESYTIYADEFNDELDLPADAEVVEVFIESFSTAVNPLSGNEATAVKINGYAQADETSLFVEDLVVSISSGSLQFVRMTNLVTTGVQDIKNALKGFVTVGNPDSITFRIEGDSDPQPGQTIQVELLIDISVSVAYEIESEFI
jgi:hypothetical protein